MWVEDGEIGGPECLGEIAAVGNNGVLKTVRQCEVRSRHNGIALGKKSGIAGNRSQCEERQLFAEQAEKRTKRALQSEMHTAKGPHINEEQQERDGHGHGLGHQGADEKNERARIPNQTAVLGVPAIGPNRE